MSCSFLYLHHSASIVIAVIDCLISVVRNTLQGAGITRLELATSLNALVSYRSRYRSLLKFLFTLVFLFLQLYGSTKRLTGVFPLPQFKERAT
jgi:hypothetical protein